ncbi:hypothetical protein LNO03_26655 [Klebsiella pneumoniae subsp. pneumoniae]|nr:hypothetical protein [Klebsiella pneumoniae subsp. pneumoniae]
MKIKLALLISASLMSGYALADSVTVNSFATISTGVSNNNPNSITVPDDRITSLQSTQGVLTAREGNSKWKRCVFNHGNETFHDVCTDGIRL